ncbi:Hypothetical Protein FCC1311_092062 [Hondaea fermentalgiana]|uniref:Uncharacterized protein n=1 Tax=Hondaea fermentalgiana TaxID=2315210 RepID=A0A2R5GQ49_9STRA|nr:Hypothetical Protein FCC1311_092062 [Hondaea fermentalgiana]|eukprot:GBG32980.1 Hypothetical Protein FCC1311_092062 [Hondaea fermentalgiana]
MKSLLKRRGKHEDANRLAKYATEKGDESNSFAALSDRLMQDLRSKITEISSEEVYSESWIQLTQVVDRIAVVVRTESGLSELSADDEGTREEKGAGDGEGKETTLWDGDEAAIRFLLEHGKTNVMLRMLETFKSAQRNALQSDCHPVTIEPRLQDASRRFESGLCTILHHALAHAEVAETIDLKVLLGTIRDAFYFAVSRPELVADTEVSLEGAGFTLLAAVVGHFERNDDEHRVMPIILELEVLALTIRHLRVNADRLSSADRAMALVAISLMVGVEDFGIHEDKYLPTSGDLEGFLELQSIVDEVLEESPDLRRSLRALTDEQPLRACPRVDDGADEEKSSGLDETRRDVTPPVRDLRAMDILACVGGRDKCLGASKVGPVVVKPILDGYASGPGESTSDAPQHRVKTIAATDVMQHFVRKKRCCNHCKTPLEADMDVLKVAKVGSAYFCFCDEDCWLNWLPAFAGKRHASSQGEEEPGTSRQESRERSQSTSTVRSAAVPVYLSKSHSYRAPRIHLL